MLELMAGDGALRQRLEAYADARLTPDPYAVRRIRARVQASAHRRAELLSADTALTVLPAPGHRGMAAVARPRAGTRRSPWRRVVPAVFAATLTMALVAGTALAAKPGGALYGGRLWLETLTLPSSPSERAVAELARLAERLREVATANAAGDTAGAAAALAAYEAIVGEAVTAAILADDPVAAAALEAGVARDVERLQELVALVPETARPALEAAIQRAIDRSGAAIDSIDPGAPGGNGSNGSDGGTGGNGGGAPAVDPTDKPTKG
ncbi:MAG TPA: hypothetical protein VF119_10780, partial [Candidatus Limnocylindrales bacterium]